MHAGILVEGIPLREPVKKYTPAVVHCHSVDARATVIEIASLQHMTPETSSLAFGNAFHLIIAGGLVSVLKRNVLGNQW